MSFLSVCWLLIVSLLVLGCDAGFEWPAATIQPFRPTGLTISIPHQPGISSFELFVQVCDYEGSVRESFWGNISRAKYNSWTYKNDIVSLKPLDEIYYTLTVIYDDGIVGQHNYSSNLQFYVVSEFYDDNGNLIWSMRPPRLPPCKLSETTVRGRSVCKGELILEENFNDTDGFLDRWRPSMQFTTYPDYSYVMYDNDLRHLYTNNGILNIKLTPSDDTYQDNFVRGSFDFGQECTGLINTEECNRTSASFHILPPVVSAQITTRDVFSFRYGVVEIRARFPKGDWIYPDLFLQPQFERYGQFGKSGFLRIATSAGNDHLNGELCGGGVLDTIDSKARKYLLKCIVRRKPWNDDFYIYRLEWRPNFIQMSVNGEIYGQIVPPRDGFVGMANQLGLDISKAEIWRKGNSMAPFDKEFFLGIGVGVGGYIFSDFETSPGFDFENPKSELWFSRMKESWYSTWNDRSELEVDYVKVWAL